MTKQHVFLPPYQSPELSWLNIKAIAELHCVERCQIFWLKYENKCEMKQKNQRGVILCIYLQYINFLVYHSYADIIALLIILESYLCNYYLCMIYVNKFFKKSKETKNKRMKSFLPLCITFLQSFTLTKSYCKDIAFIVFVETHDLRIN